MALAAAQIPNLYLRQIAVVSNRDPVVKGISRALRTSGGSRMGGLIRIQNSAIDNVRIEDALIYRST